MAALPITDAHQHLWELGDGLAMSWLDAAGMPAALKRDYTPADYAAAVSGSDVARAVYAEVEVDAAFKHLEVAKIARLCADPAALTQAIIASANPAEQTSLGHPALPEFVDDPAVRAIRWGIHFQPAGACVAPAFLAGVRRLGEAGRAFEVCIRPHELSDAAVLARACPGTTIVLDHCGNADPNVVNGGDPGPPPVPQPQAGDGTYHTWHTRDGWLTGIGQVAAEPNTVCKLSGIISRVRVGWTPATLLPTLCHCLEAFGPERCMFGGDWPLCTLGADGTTTFADWVGVAREAVAGLAPAEQALVLSGTAARVYGLADASAR
jgi:L-fuconolactonase